MDYMRGSKSIVAVLAIAFITGCPPDGSLDVPPGTDEERWLRFAQLSDIHIIDEESPARAVRFDELIHVSWRPQEAYGVHTLDATLRLLNTRFAPGPVRRTRWTLSW